MSTKSPTIKRILKEASELANSPSNDYHAAPLETDLFEWHFTIRGPPAPSPFDGGLYHGRIILPPAYPLKPPSFRFLTPTGRFEVNREICLSISGHHEETWQPAWGIRTALVAIRSFMDTDAKGQLGGMDASDEMRRRYAGQSKAWKCPACSKTNHEVMAEQDEAVKEAGGEASSGVVPEELRLAYKDNMAKAESGNENAKPNAETAGAPVTGTSTTAAVAPAPAPAPASVHTPAQQPPAPAQSVPAAVQAPLAQAPLRRPQPVQDEGIPAWIDKAIYGVVAALIALVWFRYVA